TLTAKDGFTINGQSSFKSAQFTVALIDLDITAKTLGPDDIKSEDVENNAFKSYATLQKLFAFDTAIITEEILNKAVVVTMAPSTGNQPRIITLTTTMDYSIKGSLTLDSNSFVVSTNYVITATVPTDIRPSDMEGDNYTKWPVVSKLFTGADFNEAMLVNLTITKEDINPNGYIVTLTANDGFTINGGRTLRSNQFTTSLIDLVITAKTLNPNEITAGDVDNDAFKSYATLQKLFAFDTAIITEEILNKAVVVTMTPMSGSQTRIITLTTTMDYSINGISTLDSNSFVLPTNYVISKAATIPTDIKPSDIENDEYKRWEVVSKLFTGADFQEGILGNLNIELIEVTAGQTYQIKLTPKPDFNINGGVEGITSDIFTVSVTNFVITNKENAPLDITLTKLQDSDYIKTLGFLNKLFDLGTITQTEIDNNIDVTFSNISGSEYKIILTSKFIDVKING
ncbi:MAG: hypothetical protein ACRCW3_02710, partial [Metamycoplasmataceae bacterium]